MEKNSRSNKMMIIFHIFFDELRANLGIGLSLRKELNLIGILLLAYFVIFHQLDCVRCWFDGWTKQNWHIVRYQVIQPQNSANWKITRQRNSAKYESIGAQFFLSLNSIVIMRKTFDSSYIYVVKHWFISDIFIWSKHICLRFQSKIVRSYKLIDLRFFRNCNSFARLSLFDFVFILICFHSSVNFKANEKRLSSLVTSLVDLRNLFPRMQLKSWHLNVEAMTRIHFRVSIAMTQTSLDLVSKKAAALSEYCFEFVCLFD